jgi:hypothetical protein
VASLVSKNFDSPDEQRTPDKSKVDIVRLGSTTAGRATFEPGWRWSECIKPVVGGDSCQMKHIGVVLEGTLHVVHDDGNEAEVSAGDAYVVEPGHDAWVVGDSQFVAYEFEPSSAEAYAKGS